MKDPDDKLKKLEEKRARVEAEIRRLRAAASATERKRDTRRKLLVGAVVLAAADRGEMPRAPLMALLDRNLVRSHDRELFDLPPKPDGTQTNQSLPPPPSGSAPKAPSALPGPADQASAAPAPLPRLAVPSPVQRGTFTVRPDTDKI